MSYPANYCIVRNNQATVYYDRQALGVYLYFKGPKVAQEYAELFPEVNWLNINSDYFYLVDFDRNNALFYAEIDELEEEQIEDPEFMSDCVLFAESEEDQTLERSFLMGEYAYLTEIQNFWRGWELDWSDDFEGYFKEFGIEHNLGKELPSE